MTKNEPFNFLNTLYYKTMNKGYCLFNDLEEKENNCQNFVRFSVSNYHVIMPHKKCYRA
jgi:hypothetical protein